jgi:hypothetical protein
MRRMPLLAIRWAVLVNQGGEKAVEPDDIHAIVGSDVRHKEGIQLTNLFVR